MRAPSRAGADAELAVGARGGPPPSSGCPRAPPRPHGWWDRLPRAPRRAARRNQVVGGARTQPEAVDLGPGARCPERRPQPTRRSRAPRRTPPWPRAACAGAALMPPHPSRLRARSVGIAIASCAASASSAGWRFPDEPRNDDDRQRSPRCASATAAVRSASIDRDEARTDLHEERDRPRGGPRQSRRDHSPGPPQRRRTGRQAATARGPRPASAETRCARSPGGARLAGHRQGGDGRTCGAVSSENHGPLRVVNSARPRGRRHLACASEQIAQPQPEPRRDRMRQVNSQPGSTLSLGVPNRTAILSA
jgi:hypothetical protein